MFKFNDEVHAYQSFVRNNIKALGNLIIVSEQLLVKDIDKSFIDILALDISEKRLVILELKNVIAGDAIIGQAIKYFDYLIRAEEDLKLLLSKIDLDFSINEINMNPKIMLVVPDFKVQIIRSLSYVNSIDIQIVKFNSIQYDNHYEIIKEVYIPGREYNEETIVEDNNYKIWNFEEYEKEGIDNKKIILAKKFINFIDSLYEEKSELFFYKDKISLMKGKRLICHIRINKKWFDNSIEISTSNKNITAADVMYDGNIISYSIGKRNVKIKFNALPIGILRKIFS
jgi:hypothetical protein